MFFFKPEPRKPGSRGAIRAALVILTALAVITVSCDDGGGGGVYYPTATARVDYNAANRAVFFDFSTGKTTELAHDFFDIAIDANGNIIANSGSYGTGVQVYDTGMAGSNIANDFSANEDDVKEYTFRDGVKIYKVVGGGSDYQSTENPLGTMPSPMPPGTLSVVYLVKVKYGSASATYFKVTFQMNMSNPPMSYNMKVVPGLGSGTANQVELAGLVGGLTNGYGWLYFKLVGAGGPRVLNNGTTWLEGGTAAPLAANWDLLFTRTDEFQSEDGIELAAAMPVASRSSVLLNIYGKVEAAKATGKSMEQVFNNSGLPFSGEVDAIGYSWYNMAGMPPTFSISTNTFVVKTAEGNYAKFQPGTFYGPSGESFYMTFRYLYSGDATGLFSR